MNSSAPTDNGKTPGGAGAHADGFLRFIVTLLVLAFPAATLFINRGDSYTLGLLMLIGIWVWMRDGARIWLNRDSGLLCLAFALFFAVVLLSYAVGYQTEDGFHYLGRYFRFLLIVPVYLAFRRYPPTAKTVFIGLALGALTAGVLASLEFLQAHGSIRVAAQTDLSIIFGDLTTTMVLCMVAGFGLMAASRRHWSVPLLTLCLAGGVAATLLSGTRGAWLPLFLLIPALATPAAGFLKRRYVVAILIAIIAVFSSSYFVARTDTQERLKDAVRSTVDYFIGLNTFKGQSSPRTQQEQCDNQASFLEAWLEMYPTTRNPPLIANVVKDPQLRQVGLCRGRYAVELHNQNVSKGAWYYFPRVPADGKTQSSKLLVRGVGAIALNEQGSTRVPFNSQHYIQTTVISEDVSGSSVYVYVPPNEKAWLVPLDSYWGEYSLSIIDTSVGRRFEMWRDAWSLFLRHPVLGVGTGAFQAKTHELIRRGQVAVFLRNYDHPHNDYLDALSSRGLLGFATLLAILLIPLWRFLWATRSPAHATHAIGLAGVLTVAGFAIYALTDTIFLHSIMITWYVIYMALFYALLDAQAASQTNLKPAE